MEPRFPAAVECIVNLGECYDTHAIAQQKEEIISLIDSKHPPYERVARCLQAARAVQDEAFDTVIDGDVLSKIARRARGIIAREIKQGDGGAIKKRFLSGITPAGLVCHFDTARALCPHLYILNDSYGLAHFLLAPLLAAAQQAGQDGYACYCPLNPEHKLEHLLLPSLGVGFVTSSDLYPFEGESYRRIRLDACLDPERIRASRTRLRFLRKTQNALLEDAVGALESAKGIHDTLEGLYNPHVDFARVYALADATAREILG